MSQSEVFHYMNEQFKDGYWGPSDLPDPVNVGDGRTISKDDFVYQQFVANNVQTAAVTLYVWEFLVTMPEEIRLYQRRRFFSPAVILFWLVRYGTLPAVILPAYSVWHDFSNDHDGCIPHQQLTIVVVQLIVASIFAWRTISIWRREKWIVWVMFVAVLVQCGTSFALFWYSKEELQPNYACAPAPSNERHNTIPWFYLVAVLYDTLAIGLSTFKLLQYSSIGVVRNNIRVLGSPLRSLRALRACWRSLTPLLGRLLHNGLMYFAIASAFNIVNFVLEVIEDLHANAIVSLYAPLMCILCQRIILLEVRAVWSSSDGNGTRERSLVGRVVRERRPSWAGDDVNEKGPIPAAYWGAPPIVQTEQDQREMPDLGLDVEQALENTSGGSGSDRRSVSFLSSQNSQNSLERVQTSSTNRTKAALFGGKSHSKSSRRRISVPKSIAALAPGARQRRRSPSSIAITNGSGSGRSDQFRKSPSSSRAGTFVNTGAQQPSSPHSSPGQSTSETFATLAEADRSLALRMAGLDPHGEEQRDALRRADRRRAWAKRHANGEGADTFDLDDEGDEGRDDVFGAGAERVGEGEQEEDWETDRDTNGFGHGRDARAIPSSRGLEEEVELQDRASPTRRSGQGRSAIV